MEQYDFKVGDLVAYTNSRGVLFGIKTVARLTKTQVILDTDNRFRRNDGRAIAVGGIYRGRIEPVTERHYRILKKRELLARITNVNMEGLDVEKLEKILAIVEGK